MFKPYMIKKKQITLEDQHQTERIIHSGPSCFIQKQNILIKAESEKSPEKCRNCLISLTDLTTGQSKGFDSEKILHFIIICEKSKIINFTVI